MKKAITVNNVNYEFFLDEELNMWRTIENHDLILNQIIDLEIDLANVGTDFELKQIESFIEFIQVNNQKVAENILDAQSVLLALFKSINKHVYDDVFLKNIVFSLSGIDFKGKCKIINMNNQFEYDYFFFPHYTIDKYRDIGSFVWRANFRNCLLLGVYCDRI